MELQERNKRIDELEAFLVGNFPLGEAPVSHYFADGMYGREMRAKADTLITSKIHKYDHEFILSEGKIIVWTDDPEDAVLLEAPYMGFTKAGTRRVGLVLEDIVWTTFHVVDIKPKDESEGAIEEAVRLIENEIIQPHENKLLTN
jgi:hypothetical protein